MKIERTKNAKKNILYGLILRVYQMLVPFLMRTAMIYFMGVQYLGLNSLFASVLHILNLAELGVGVAMVFSMYRPIAEDDEAAICALMGLYRRYYRLIGLVIGSVGLVLTPLVPELISGEIPADLNIYVLYLLNLGTTVLTYWLFAYKNCLLQAHQRTDVVSLITGLTSTVQFALQLVVLVLFRNYYLYVITAMVTQVLNNIVTAVVVTRMYPRYQARGRLPKERTRELNGTIRDIFTGKLGSVVLSSADTVVISAFLGLVPLAIYQNYYFILSSIIAIVEIILSSMMAGLGNSFVTETKQKNFRDLKKFTFLFLWLTGVCTCCFLGLYQPFMEIWVGRELMLDFPAVICFCGYFFVYTLNRLLSIYKDAAGLWHRDRLRPLCTSLLNLGLNLLWVRSFGIYGVLLSTVVSMVGLGMPWILNNIFTEFFDRKEMGAYLKLVLTQAGATVCAGAVVYLLCAQLRLPPWPRLVLSGLVCACVPNAVFFLLLRRNDHFAPAVRFLDQLTGGRLKLAKRLLGR